MINIPALFEFLFFSVMRVGTYLFSIHLLLLCFQYGRILAQSIKNSMLYYTAKAILSTSMNFCLFERGTYVYLQE